MDTDSIDFAADQYIRAATDPQLSSVDNRLLDTLLSEEDQHDYAQLLTVQLSPDILQIINQLTSLFHISSSAIWMSIVLLKKLVLQQTSIDLLTIVACVTLSCKYQDSSSQSIDYQLILQFYPIETIRQIHDMEIYLLDVLDYDVCVPTPDHFFSYFNNLANNHSQTKEIIEKARSLFSMTLLSNETIELFYNYPSSIVTLSFIYNIDSKDSFIVEQMKSFLFHKKDRSHYMKELLQCTVLLQSVTSS